MSTTREEAFAETSRLLKPALEAVDAIFMENVEFCEVNEAYQRFRDFLFELNRVRERGFRA